MPIQIVGFEIVYQNGSGMVRRHIAVNINEADYKYLESIAKDKAGKGYTVEMLPTLEPHDPERKALFNGAKENKCPDLRINGQYVEVEGVKKDKLSTISNAIKNGHQPADIVIIHLHKEKAHDSLYRIANGRLKTHFSLKSVEFYYNGVSVAIFTK